MIENRRSAARCSYLLFACVPLLWLSGCDMDGGPARYEASGTVTYQGAPVPYGEIIFEPDSSKGNEGPATQAIIQNGAYITEKEKGVVEGPLRVRISGFDGKVPPGGGTMPHGKALFTDHIELVTQPGDVATHDFSITKK